MSPVRQRVLKAVASGDITLMACSEGACVCPAGICRDPWAYLCVGPSGAAAEWGVRFTDAYGVMEVISYGPHRQTAEQAVFLAGHELVARTCGESGDWVEVER